MLPDALQTVALEQGQAGARPPLRPKHVWSIRTKLQIDGRARDLAMFKLAIDSKLRGCNLAHEWPLCAVGSIGQRNTLIF
jgi:hypothetical protein